MLYKNRRDPTVHSPSHNPPPTRERKVAEEEITSQTHLILHELRRTLRRTQLQTSLDKYINVVGPRFAFDNMGTDRIPIRWKPGIQCHIEDWWHIFQTEIVSRIVMTYFDAIREGDLAIIPWQQAIDRLREMLKVGVYEYKLASPVDKFKFTLMTQKEWNIFKEEQIEAEQKKAEEKERALRGE